MDIQPTNYVTNTADTVNGEQQIFNQIKSGTSNREQLKKVAKEFESVFISKMFSMMDQTVDREGGIFGEETQYADKFKSFVFDDLGRQLANDPHSTFGFAKQIYAQMEKALPPEPTIKAEG